MSAQTKRPDLLREAIRRAHVVGEMVGADDRRPKRPAHGARRAVTSPDEREALRLGREVRRLGLHKSDLYS